MQQLGYIKQIDGLRAIAVMMVVVFHWFAGGVISQSGMGSIGVDIFFTLSGFLITRILLVYRWNHDQGIDKKSKVNSVLRFMYRRSLRIFPAYFMLLFFLYHFDFFLYNTLKSDLKWYVTYLQNFLFYFRQAWAAGKLSPFWTLAVEEQFYLFWPWLILFVPAKRLGLTIVILLFIGLSSILVLPLILEKKVMFDILTPTCLHAFGAGALVAYMHIVQPEKFAKKGNIFLLTGLILIFISFISRIYNIYLFIDHRSLVSAGTSLLICYLLSGSLGFFSEFVLGNSILVWIGKVSYGIYLFHNFIPAYLKGLRISLAKYYPNTIILPYFPDIANDRFYFFVLCFVVLFILSWGSFRFFEKPLLNFKNAFS
jgi:peptidoglycan/LPS O-acetylase OafA/YrhL